MSRYAISQADFRLFVILWNQKQNLSTPAHHLAIIRWLEAGWIKGNKRLLLQAFRSSGKSTIVGLFAAWLLYRNPDLRILVLAADLPLAKKMVRQVRKILEKHPLTFNLRPDKPDEWAGEYFTVRRPTNLRDPSMMAKGITSNITGSRADVIICDDVEVPNTCDTAGKRQELRERLMEISFVLVPDGTQLYVGTPHTYNTIYADKPRTELGEETPFLQKFSRMNMPVLNVQGQSIWNEKFPLDALERQKLSAGPNKFASQMMLQPVNIMDGRLDHKLVKPYNLALEYSKELKTLFLGKTKLTGASAWWDPAFASAKGDKSVLAVIFADEDENRYLHHLEYIKLDPHSKDDEATQQCKIVAELAKKFLLPSLHIETNGIGNFLPNMLRNAMKQARSLCSVIEKHSSRAKDLRILEAFDPILASGRLYVHRDVFKTQFMTEMQEWQPEISKGYDDGLDAVAGALEQKPLIIAREYLGGAHTWMKSSATQTANTDFEV